MNLSGLAEWVVGEMLAGGCGPELGRNRIVLHLCSPLPRADILTVLFSLFRGTTVCLGSPALLATVESQAWRLPALR